MAESFPAGVDTQDAETLRRNAASAARLLKSLANEQRLLILCRLVSGEHCVSELGASLPLSQSALSQHLAVLRRDGIVQCRREAQSIYYRLSEGPGQILLQSLKQIYCPSSDAHSSTSAS